MPANQNPYQAPLHGGIAAMRPKLDPARVIRWIEGLGKLLILHAFVQPLTSLFGIAFFYPDMLTRYPSIIAGFLLLMLLMNLLSSYWILQFKGSLFCLATLLLGLANVLTLFSALPTICVSAFGLFVLSRPAAREMFEMRVSGKSKLAIIEHFQNLDADV